MYNYITGRAAHGNGTGTLTLETNGIGYLIHASQALLSTARAGETLTVYTHLDIKETAHTLYGFADSGEREMFTKLLSVSGIGAKSALAILSLGTDEITKAVLSGNPTRISTVKGVGTKAAQKVVLELKNKISKTTAQDFTNMLGTSDNVEDAVTGLTNLGLTRPKAVELVSQIETANLSAEQIITAALALRGRG